MPWAAGGSTDILARAVSEQLTHSLGVPVVVDNKAGALKLLAVTEAKRSSLLPDVPTVAETVPGYELSVWYGAFAPPGTPKEIVARLNAEINKVLNMPDIKSRMSAIGVEVATTTPEQFTTLLKKDEQRYGKLIRDFGIRAE